MEQKIYVDSNTVHCAIRKPRMGGAQYYLDKKKKQTEMMKLASIILNECSTKSSIFNTLCWLDQKGMLNEKSVTAFLKYKEKDK